MEDKNRPAEEGKKTKSLAEQLADEAFGAEQHNPSPQQPSKPEEPASYKDIFSGTYKEQTPKEPSRFDEWGDEVSKAAGQAGQKAQEISEKVGKRVLEASDEINKRLEEKGSAFLGKAQAAGEKLMGKFDDLLEKANQEANAASFDDMTAEARRMQEELEAKVKARGQRSNTENVQRDREKGPLGGFESFFDKASRYADGDYSDDGPHGLRKDPDYKPKKNEGKVKGFEDLDGDGDEIIDDAIIDDDGQ